MALGFSSGTWAEAFRRRDFAVIADWFSVYFFGFGVAGVFAAGIAAWLDVNHFAAGFRIFCLSLLFGAASTVCGWLLGLLFGVPRTLASPGTVPAGGGGGGGPAGKPAPSQGPATRVNTNLEEISDWLTKTLVGVGLTQLNSVPHYLWSVANQLNISGFAWNPYGQLLALVLFLYFAPGGFWLGYVGTRTVLTQLFDSIERAGAADIKAATDPVNLRLDIGARGPDGAPSADIAPAANPRVAATDRVLLSTPLHEINSVDELAAWGAAQARTRNYSAALTALKDAVRAEPRNGDFKQALASVYTATGQHNDARQVLGDAPSSDVGLLSALYEPPPEGFRKAIRIGEDLLRQSDQSGNANLHVWLACAYGQQYGFEKANGADAGALQAIKDKALREVRAALQADASTRGALRSFWKPPPGSNEDDLASFPQDDPDLTAILG